jgi:hypothetical protein
MYLRKWSVASVEGAFKAEKSIIAESTGKRKRYSEERRRGLRAVWAREASARGHLTWRTRRDILRGSSVPGRVMRGRGRPEGVKQGLSFANKLFGAVSNRFNSHL